MNVIPAKRGNNHVTQLLSEVAKCNHKLKVGESDPDASQSFNRMLNKLNRVCKHNALVILISDGYGWNEQSSDAIKQLRQHNELINCLVFDPIERDLPEMTQMVVSDGKWQIQFSSEEQTTQDKYKDALEQQLHQFESASKSIEYRSLASIHLKMLPIR